MAEERCHPEEETAQVTGLLVAFKMKSKHVACTAIMSIRRLKIDTSSGLVKKFLSREWCAGGLLIYRSLFSTDLRYLWDSFPERKGLLTCFIEIKKAPQRRRLN